MAIAVTGGATAVLLCLRPHAVPTGQEMFVEVRRLGATGRAIARLQCENLGIVETARLAALVWLGVRREAHDQAVEADDTL